MIVVLGAVASAALADRAPASQPGTDAGRLPADARRIYDYVKKPLPGELRWQQIPWQVDLGQAIRQAKAENRPILIFVSGDDPLEKC